MGDVGQRALEQERRCHVERQQGPHPQPPRGTQGRRGDGDDRQHPGGEADVAGAGEVAGPHPRHRRECPDEQRRDEDTADLAGDRGDHRATGAQPQLARPDEDGEHDHAGEVLRRADREEPAGEQRPDLRLLQGGDAVGDLREPVRLPDRLPDRPRGHADDERQTHDGQREGDAPQRVRRRSGHPAGPGLEPAGLPRRGGRNGGGGHVVNPIRGERKSRAGTSVAVGTPHECP